MNTRSLAINVFGLPELRQIIVAVVNPNGTKAGISLEPVYDEDGNLIYEIVPGSGSPIAKQNTSGGFYGSITLSGNHGNNRDLTINNQGYLLIRDMTQLAAISGTTDRYALAQNLNLSAAPYTGPVVETLASSTFAGLGHTIDGLKISNSSAFNVGLFGTIVDSAVRDLGVTNVNINVSGGNVGALAGTVNGVSTLRGLYSTGTITATSGTAGGLIGAMGGSEPVLPTLTDAYSSVSGVISGGLIGYAGDLVATRVHATGNGGAGGLIGSFQPMSPLSKVSYSYATGASRQGGLIGGLYPEYFADDKVRVTAVSDSFATGAVTGGGTIGGLIGIVNPTAGALVLNNTWASGAVTANDPAITGSDGIGGLVGRVSIPNAGNFSPLASFLIRNSHATGAVTVTPGYAAGADPKFVGYAGGLVGYFQDMDQGSVIQNSYATGDVNSSKENAGGLAGSIYGVSIFPLTYSTGNVTCLNVCGGLVGSVGGPARQFITIRGAFTTGTVTATAGGQVIVGALIGQATGTQRLTIGENVAFNAAGNPGMSAIGSGNAFNVGSIRSQGLNAAQLADARFYANGTINQVLADRANAAQAAAVLQAVAQAAVAQQGVAAQGASIANSISNNARTSSLTPPDLSASEAGTRAAKSEKSAAIEESVKSVDDAVKADDKRQEQERARERERRRAAAQASRRGQAGGGGGLGATIRSIDVNGQRFNLDGGGAPKPDAPAQAPQ